MATTRAAETTAAVAMVTDELGLTDRARRGLPWPGWARRRDGRWRHCVEIFSPRLTHLWSILDNLLRAAFGSLPALIAALAVQKRRSVDEPSKQGVPRVHPDRA